MIVAGETVLLLFVAWEAAGCLLYFCLYVWHTLWSDAKPSESTGSDLQLEEMSLSPSLFFYLYFCISTKIFDPGCCTAQSVLTVSWSILSVRLGLKLLCNQSLQEWWQIVIITPQKSVWMFKCLVFSDEQFYKQRYSFKKYIKKS